MIDAMEADDMLDDLPELKKQVTFLDTYETNEDENEKLK